MSEKKKTLKNSIKFETRIKQCMFVPDFSQFGETSVFRIKFAQKKHFRIEYLDKCMQPESNLF